jgi:hypothetical protein
MFTDMIFASVSRNVGTKKKNKKFFKLCYRSFSTQFYPLTKRSWFHHTTNWTALTSTSKTSPIPIKLPTPNPFQNWSAISVGWVAGIKILVLSTVAALLQHVNLILPLWQKSVRYFRSQNLAYGHVHLTTKMWDVSDGSCTLYKIWMLVTFRPS